MKPFEYHQATAVGEAVAAVASNQNATFLAGGTTLVDLMKIHVLTPQTVIGTYHLPLTDIEVTNEVVRIGANVRNSQLAWDPLIRDQFPVLSQAILSGATTQIRNMATVAGNILQRTRCNYFRDVHSACNRRQPGSGCDAIEGFNRGHAVLGTSKHCIATHPSDMCVAMIMLDAQIQAMKADGSMRTIPLAEFHRLPGDTPEAEVALEHGELITHITLPRTSIARRSRYLKVRDRASYEFALASAAVALSLAGKTITAARIAVGGIATKPWRCLEAENTLVGRRATSETFRDAAEAALAGAIARKHNGFKIELAKRTIIGALSATRDMTV